MLDVEVDLIIIRADRHARCVVAKGDEVDCIGFEEVKIAILNRQLDPLYVPNVSRSSSGIRHAPARQSSNTRHAHLHRLPNIARTA